MSRVALIGENSIGYVNALVDIWNNGDCAVLLDWRIPFLTATEMMIEADVHTCFIENSLFKKLEDKIPVSIEFIAYEKQNSSAELLPNYIYEKFRKNYSRNEAIVIYSSGTTGKSKGIILSHFAINTNADAIIDYMKPTKDDCISIVKTISHASSLVGELLVSLKTKTPLLIAPIIVPPRYTFSNISKYKVTIMCINPTLLQMYMDDYGCNYGKYDLSSLKELYVNGAKANLKICNKALTVFKQCAIYYEYGLSEAGPRVTTQKIQAYCLDSVGKPINNVQIKVVSPPGNETKIGEYGLVHVKTPSQYSGYISGESKFQSLYRDWINTGDIGYFDEFNELHIVGRADDVIVIDAHKIYPSEVEKQVVELADIIECAVAKVEHNGNEFIGCLYVSDQKIDQDIKLKLKTSLLPYEIPRFFLRGDALPRTKNEKVSTREVQACLQKYMSRE